MSTNGSGEGGGGAGSALVRLSKEQALVGKKPVPGVVFAPGGESNPLEWTMTVDAPVRVGRGAGQVGGWRAA